MIFELIIVWVFFIVIIAYHHGRHRAFDIGRSVWRAYKLSGNDNAMRRANLC